MHGVSEVIAIILILMITISLAGLAYMFMSSTMSDVTSSASSTIDTTTTSMLTTFKIETIDVAKVYVRNTGQNPITSLSAYVNDAPAHISMTPSSIAPGQIGTITIYNYIGDGDTVKIASPNGFTASKKAPDPCDKAFSCWHFNEGSGAITYDSSSSNYGTLSGGATWTSGKVGSALSCPISSSILSLSQGISTASNWTINLWSYFPLVTSASWKTLFRGALNDHQVIVDSSGFIGVYDNVYVTGFHSSGYNTSQLSGWHYISILGYGSVTRFYVDGVFAGDSNYKSSDPINYICNFQGLNQVWGSVDEIYFFNRVIY